MGRVLSLGPIARQSINGDSPQDLALQQATSKCHKSMCIVRQEENINFAIHNTQLLIAFLFPKVVPVILLQNILI